TRSLQPFDGVPMPYLFDFVAWFIKCADLSAEMSECRSAAVGCLCRLICRRHDQPMPEDLLPHFYKILFKELPGDDLKLIYAIINNCTSIFASCLPGSSILIPTFLKCIKKLFSGAVKDSKIPDLVRQNAITILFSLIGVSNHFTNLDHPPQDVSVTDLPSLPPLPQKSRKGSAASLLSTSSTDALSKSAAEIHGSRKLSTLSSTFHLFSSSALGVGEGEGDVSEMQFVELKGHLKDTLLFLLDWEREPVRGEKSPETHAMLLWGVAVMAFDEMVASRNPLKEIIDDCINALLDHLTLSNLKVINAAIDGLTLFAKNSKILPYMDASILSNIIHKLVGAITEQLMFQSGVTGKEIRGQIISRLLYHLLDWVLALPTPLFSSPKLSLLVFEVIENAVNISTTATDDASGQSPTTTTAATNHSNPGSVRLKAMKIGTESSASSSTNLGIKGFVQRHGSLHLKNENSGGDEEGCESVIKEAAENVLLHIIHHIDNFPNSHGPALQSSQIVDPTFVEDPKDDEKSLYFTFNDTTLITLIEIPGATPLETRSRLIARDLTGKYVWDSYLFYENLSKMKRRIERWEGVFEGSGGKEGGPIIVVRDDEGGVKGGRGVDKGLKYKLSVDVDDEPEPVAPREKRQVFGEDEVPLYCADKDLKDVDMLGELLKYIGKKHPECLISPHIPIDIPQDVKARVIEDIKEMSLLMDQQLQFESPYQTTLVASKAALKLLQEETVTSSRFPSTHNVSILSMEAPLTPTQKIDPLMKTYKHARPAASNSKTTPFGRSRLFLSHFGHMNFDGLKEDYFHLLAKSPALYRDIKGLDKKFGRETLKIAVIYVGPGQEDEQTLLKNVGGSFEYQEFVSSLGWEIDISTHPGYLGGLERSQATGVKATYFCDSTMEIVFHDVTKMPTDPMDPKQLKKKRHIGNDHIHIVWNEHYRDYRKNTIGGDFGNAQVVVTPMSSGLYTIDVMRDAKVIS
ncbi:Ral GTPase-activating protein subunit alpha-1, partial [Dinochytrium kinnereticum]